MVPVSYTSLMLMVYPPWIEGVTTHFDRGVRQETVLTLYENNTIRLNLKPQTI